jgi:hypothetical protein
MASVRIADKKVWVDDVSIPLLSGEVHYWRLDPANWLLVLQRAREMGLQVIATYVCWDFHELEPGRYDFRGETDPRRNLLGFLDLLTDEDFWIILRPGPYIYSEWRNNGVPDDAACLHRLDPAFQGRASPYMQSVVDATRSYLATRGGPIILWQADTEIDPWAPWYTEQRGRDHLTVIGLAPFPELIRALYDHVDVDIPSRSLTPQISTALFLRDEEFYLIAVNSGEEAKIAEVTLTTDFLGSPCWHVRNVLDNQEWTIDLRVSNHVTFPVPRKDGVILQLGAT